VLKSIKGVAETDARRNEGTDHAESGHVSWDDQSCLLERKGHVSKLDNKNYQRLVNAHSVQYICRPANKPSKPRGPASARARLGLPGALVGLLGALTRVLCRGSQSTM